MFTGSHQLTVDDKGRLAIPARVRQQLLEDHGAKIFITRGPHISIEIYPEKLFRALADQIANLADRKAADMLSDVFVGHAVDTEVDKQGRVLLPAVLREHARIEQSVRLVGKINRLDIWAEDRWAEKYGESRTEALVDAYALLKR